MFLEKLFKFIFIIMKEKNFIEFLKKQKKILSKKKTIYEKGPRTSIPVVYASGHFEVKINKQIIKCYFWKQSG